jgi:hypothetical protein
MKVMLGMRITGIMTRIIGKNKSQKMIGVGRQKKYGKMRIEKSFLAF